MNKGKILIVEDSPQVRRTLRSSLAPHGYAVTEARNGEEGVAGVRAERPDLVLLDLNMPGMGGLAACREIRTISDAAIIVVTVRDSERDKVQALDAGADDYITKPFSMPELLARVRAALRRIPLAPGSGPEKLVAGDLTIDFAARRVTLSGKESRLTPKEFDLLRFLTAHPNEAIPHRQLLQSVWGPDYGNEVEYLRVFVNQLRKKIERDPAQPVHLLTEPWVGYRFVPAAKPE